MAFVESLKGMAQEKPVLPLTPEMLLNLVVAARAPLGHILTPEILARVREGKAPGLDIARLYQRHIPKETLWLREQLAAASRGEVPCWY